jgi:hypothetical protein
MAGGSREIHRDDDYLATGTHKGADGAASLFDPGKDLKSCGVIVGLAIYNTTQVTNGLVTASTEDTVTDDTNTWDNGDTYEIYKTAAKNQVVSSIWTDVSRGWKSDKKELQKGWRAEDLDVDRKKPGRVFGPGQPEKGH